MKILDFFKRVKNYFYFKVNEFKNYYPYKLIGESKLSAENETHVIYKSFGYNNIYEESITKLFENKDMLYKFHPEDVSKITFVAFGELFFCGDMVASRKKFCEIKREFLNKMGDNSNGS